MNQAPIIQPIVNIMLQIMALLPLSLTAGVVISKHIDEISQYVMKKFGYKSDNRIFSVFFVIETSLLSWS